MEEEIYRLSTSPNIIQFVLKKDAFWNYNLSKYAKRKDLGFAENSMCKDFSSKENVFSEIFFRSLQLLSPSLNLPIIPHDTFLGFRNGIYDALD